MNGINLEGEIPGWGGGGSLPNLIKTKKIVENEVRIR